MYTIDGVPLSDPYRRWTVHRETQRRTPVAFRSVDVNVPGGDGNIPIFGENIEATALALELNVYGRTPDQIEERVNFLRSLLGRTTGPLEVARRDGKVAAAKPAAISDPVRTDVYARLSITLSIPAGVWRGPESTWTHPSPLTTGPQAATSFDGASRPITDSLILITGPATTPTVTDTATGSTVRYTGAVPAGQKLLVDCAEWRAALGSSVSWGSTASTATAGIVSTGPRSDTTLFPLTPIPGLNGDGDPTTAPSLRFAATSTDAATALQIRARTSHL
ncbi:hypothetical protein [Brevibacterium aurantiacum]|uniref:Uncharacterized protein n=1 Tax=Brevibacterium aurantiacum TaxID=273384 RepID=A0A556C3E1_BREAU|nr:hypothetical protein [Brevibacterium aurantiacum]TSI11975.1 hypothetical protein FO013_21265 [Brevibacterium aurantiacum]